MKPFTLHHAHEGRQRHNTKKHQAQHFDHREISLIGQANPSYFFTNRALSTALHLPSPLKIRTAIQLPQAWPGHTLGARSTPHPQLGLQPAPTLRVQQLLPLLSPNPHVGPVRGTSPNPLPLSNHSRFFRSPVTPSLMHASVAIPLLVIIIPEATWHIPGAAAVQSPPPPPPAATGAAAGSQSPPAGGPPSQLASASGATPARGGAELKSGALPPNSIAARPPSSSSAGRVSSGSR